MEMASTDSDTNNSTTRENPTWKNKEEKRISDVLDYDLSDFDINDEGLMAITTLATIICKTQMSFVTLVGNTYVDFLSRVGCPLTGTGRENSFCDLAIEQGEFFEVCDSTKDPRFTENVFVKGSDTPLKYYGGYPLKSPNGYNLGSLCVCDLEAKKLNDEQILALKTLSEQVVVHLELRKQNKKLNEALKRADKLSKAKDDFVSNMSHELRTPLNAINGFTDVIMKTSLDTEQREAIGIIKSSCEILITLINDILDFSKIESGKLAIERIPFNLRKAMKNIKDLLIKKADEKENKLHLMIDETIPDNLLGDKVRINQVVVNLVGNALKFTEKGVVTISIKKSKEVEETDKEITLDFSVKDTGIGIPADKLESIFERFEQAGQETTRKYGGTGLGLNISKNLVELHKGKLQVRSEVGKGSEFFFSITYGKVNEEEELKTNLDPKLLADYESLHDIKILVCEDNLVNIKLIKNLFKNKLSLIEIAENGRIAIEILSKNKKFDVILMDIHMPEMDGIETTKYIRNVMKLNIPIIGFTANCSKSERDHCLLNGMNDYITKTFVSNEFYEKLSKAFPGKKKFKEDEAFAILKSPMRKNRSTKEVNKFRKIGYNSKDSDKKLIKTLKKKNSSALLTTFSRNRQEREAKENNEAKEEIKINVNKHESPENVNPLELPDNLDTPDATPHTKKHSGFSKQTPEIVREPIYTNVIIEVSNPTNSEIDEDVYENFDVKQLNDFSDHDNDFESELMKLFFLENEDQMTRLKIALEERNLVDVKFYVHKMKSPLSMFRFNYLIGKLEYIEALLEFDTTVTEETLMTEYEKVKVTSEHVISQMRKYLETIVSE